MTSLQGKDILRASDLTMDEVELIMRTAFQFERMMGTGQRIASLSGSVLATLFYEPSTRTRLSFESAMLRMGGQVISVAEARLSSSAAKGETLFDTGKMIENYADVVVIRHPIVGSAAELADGAAIPVINGGDGAGEHPTQALLDLFTIRKEKGRVEGLTVALVGDLRNGRTVHSLCSLLANFGTRFYFVAPPGLTMPTAITGPLRNLGVEVIETDSVRSAAVDSDILYVIRLQKERFEDQLEYERLKGSYVVDADLVKASKPGVTILHPLPRVDEIKSEVDAYEGAAYFRQAANGVVVRMALLALVLGRI